MTFDPFDDEPTILAESGEEYEDDIDLMSGDGDIPETDDEMYAMIDEYVGKHRISA